MEILENIAEMIGSDSTTVGIGLCVAAALLVYAYHNADTFEETGVKRIIALMTVALLAVGAVGYHQYILRMQAVAEVTRLQNKIEEKEQSEMFDYLLQKVRSKETAQANTDTSDAEEEAADFDDTTPNDGPEISYEPPAIDLPEPPAVPNVSGYVGPNLDDQYVAPYVRSDGTFVQGHWRTRANGTAEDNYSYDGNINPYTGEIGHKKH